MNDVVFLKLVNGETLLTKVTVNENAGVLMLDKPVVLIPMGPNLALRPWLIGSNFEQPVTLDMKHIMVATDPEPQLASQYMQQYHMNVVLPSAGDVAAVNATKGKKELVLG